MGRLDTVGQLNDEISRRLADAKISIDRPATVDGSWAVDVEHGGHTASVEFRPGEGFGIAAPNGGYGEGPDVVVKDVSTASDQAVTFLVATRLLEDSPGREEWQRELLENVRSTVERAVDRRFQSIWQELLHEISGVS